MCLWIFKRNNNDNQTNTPIIKLSRMNSNLAIYLQEDIFSFLGHILLIRILFLIVKQTHEDKVHNTIRNSCCNLFIFGKQSVNF